MLRCLIVGGLGLCLAGSACADIVVLKDGRKYSGEVTKTGDGYSVKTKLGTIQVAARNTRPANVEFAYCTQRYRLAMHVQQINSGVRYRSTNTFNKWFSTTDR